MSRELVAGKPRRQAPETGYRKHTNFSRHLKKRTYFYAFVLKNLNLIYYLRISDLLIAFSFSDRKKTVNLKSTHLTLQTPMKRFFIEPTEVIKESPKITGQEAQHIAKVFRLKPKDRIHLIDGTGTEYEAEITDVSKTGVSVNVLKKYQTHTESPVQIGVGQGYLKDKKMDVLVRHLTEIGITKWMPVLSAYSVPQPDAKKNDPRIRRWETIAIEAAKQCGRTRIPEIAPPTTLSRALEETAAFDLKIIFYENENGELGRTLNFAGQTPSSIFVLFGPEGGFSEGEVAQAKSFGYVSASLGPRILRAETASISACALIQHLFGDMR